VTGCTKVPEGCDNYVAETFAERWRRIPGHPFEQGFDVRLWPDRLGLPLRRRKPTRYFVNSMSDLWHGAVGTDFLAQVVAVTALADRHTFQVLTKRPGRMHSLPHYRTYVRFLTSPLGWVPGRPLPSSGGCAELAAWPAVPAVKITLR